MVEHLSSLQEALVSIPSPMVKLGLEVHPCNLNTWKSGDRRIGRSRLSSATQRIWRQLHTRDTVWKQKQLLETEQWKWPQTKPTLGQIDNSKPHSYFHASATPVSQQRSYPVQVGGWESPAPRESPGRSPKGRRLDFSHSTLWKGRNKAYNNQALDTTALASSEEKQLRGVSLGQSSVIDSWGSHGAQAGPGELMAIQVCWGRGNTLSLAM